MGTDSSKIPSAPSETRRPAAVSYQKCAQSPPKKGDLQQFHSKSARGPLQKRETCSSFIPKVRAVPSKKGRPAAVSYQKCAWSPPKKGDLQQFHAKSARSPLKGQYGHVTGEDRDMQNKTPRHRWMTGCRIRKWQLPTLPPGGAVPSAMVSLTSLFGMGRGGSSPL